MSNDVAHRSCLKPIALPVWLRVYAPVDNKKRYINPSRLLRNTHVGYGVHCRVKSGYDWSDICQPWGEGERPALLRCLAVSADAFSNQTCRRTLFIHKTMLLTAKLVIFLCSVISQGKVVALDRWGWKWNHLLMTHRLATNYAKNYCNRTLIVKVIVENVVTCFLGTQCRWRPLLLAAWTNSSEKRL